MKDTIDQTDIGFGADTKKFLNQKLSTKRKMTPEYCKSNLEELIKMSSFNGRLFNNKDATLINLAKGKLDEADFKYVTNPYGLENKSFPAELFKFNIIKGKKFVLKGEKIKRGSSFSVIASNEESYSEVNEAHKAMLNENLQKMVVNMLQKNKAIQPQVDANGVPQDHPVQTPEQVDKFMRTKWKSGLEIAAQRSLNVAKRQTYLNEKFVKGFENLLDTNKEVYHVTNVSNEPVVRHVNTCYFDCWMSPDSNWVEDALACLELQLMTVSEVYDEFYDQLSPTDVDTIERYRTGRGGVFNDTPISSGIPFVNITNFGESKVGQTGLVPVIRGAWQTLVKVGKLTWFNEDTGLVEKDWVDETFKLTQEATVDENGNMNGGQEIEWFWMNGLWEATKIGNSIYLNHGPGKSYYKSLDNPAKVKQNYVGYFSNDPSLVEDMKPYQYFYIVLLWRLQNAFASDKGKIMLMDISQVPSSKGWNLKRWMYYLEAMKIGFIDPYSEGHIKRHGKAASFNQFKEIDLTLGNQIDKYIMMLDKIDALLGEMTGITRARQGQTASSETVGGIERSVVQSTHITEPYFFVQDSVESRVLRALLDVCKDCNKEGKKIHSFDSDGNRLYFEVGGLEASFTEYDVWVSNASKDMDKLAQLKQVAKEMAASGKATMTDMVTVILSDSISEVAQEVRDSDAATNARLQQQQKDQLDSNERINKIKAGLDQQKINILTEKNRIAEEANIRDNDTQLMLKDKETETRLLETSVEASMEQSTQEEKNKSLDLKQEELDFKRKHLKDQEQNKIAMHKDKIQLEHKKLAKKPVGQ